MAAKTLTEHVSARIGKPMRRELAKVAKRQDRSEGAIIRQALREYLNRQNGVDE